MPAPDLSVFGKLRSFDDYQRLQEEFQMQKLAQQQATQLNALQMQKAQKDLNSTDLKSLAEQSLFAYNQGQPMTPEGRAALETLAVLEGSKTSFQPDEFGNVRAVTQPNPFQQFLGQSGGAASAPPVPLTGGDPMAASRAAISQRMSDIGPSPYQGDLSVEPMDLAGIEQMMGASPALNMPVSGSPGKATDFENMLNMRVPDYRNLMAGVSDAGPKTTQLAQEEAVKLEAAKQKASYEDQLKAANEEMKSGQANAKVATVLSRMNQINEALKNKGAIVSSKDSYAQRVAATAATTNLGQGIRKFNDPEAQALAEEYRNLQATLLPYYANAAGLGAKSLDSEGERKSILQSFGDPAGIYDANQQQLNTLSQLFGVNVKGAPSASGQNRLRYNPKTGNFE